MPQCDFFSTPFSFLHSNAISIKDKTSANSTKIFHNNQIFTTIKFSQQSNFQLHILTFRHKFYVKRVVFENRKEVNHPLFISMCYIHY